jgi:hypothetical protein
MFSRKELAAAQRNSQIFEENDPAIITSPNYKRNDRTNAYRYALQQQIIDDEQSKRQEKMTADDHPLEMKVHRHQLKQKTAEEDAEDQTFQIGAQDNRSLEDRRSAQAKYRAQLEADSYRFKEMVHSDDPLAGRKPYIRRPVSPSDSWNIGKDEAVTKLQKKKEANEFYRQEMIAHPPAAATKTRHRNAAEDTDSNSGVGFNIGRDELELRALKALQRQEYRDALDEQKVIDEARRSSQLKKERNEERLQATSKLPYSQH